MAIPRKLSLRRGSSAFTLIELLLVLAVIAVLTVLIFGAFARVTEHVGKAECIANLKQIGSAVAAYAGDHNGAFPRGGWGDGGALPMDPPATDGVGWLTDIYPYVGRERDVFVCPAGDEHSPSGAAAWVRMPDSDWSEPRYPMHYAYNAQLNTNRMSFRDNEPPLNLDRMVSARRLGGVPVLLDIVFQNNFYGGVSAVFNPSPAADAQEAFAARHGGEGNVLWADGAVSSHTAEEWAALPGQRVTEGGWQRYRFCIGDY